MNVEAPGIGKMWSICQIKMIIYTTRRSQFTENYILHLLYSVGRLHDVGTTS